MEKKDIIAFFDRLAPGWDADMIKDDGIIAAILHGAGVKAGDSVLDVACGTGVMIPYYLERDVAAVTAVDISPEMAKIAAAKFPQENVTVLCADIEQVDLGRKFDRIVVYNAFPHFPDPEHLVEVLSGMLASGGTLTVAHGMSRARIDHHHEGTASKVSRGLIHEDALAAIFEKFLTVTVKISNDHMYQVTGEKR